MLFGSFNHTLDNKNRLVIPARFRKGLSSRLYLLKGYDGCLSVFDEKSFELYIQKINEYPFEKKDSRDVIRIALSSVVELEVDAKNRIQIPLEIIDKYSMSNDLMIVGVIDHIEIWNLDKWNKYLDENSNQFEEKAEKLLGDKNV